MATTTDPTAQVIVANASETSLGSPLTADFLVGVALLCRHTCSFRCVRLSSKTSSESRNQQHNTKTNEKVYKQIAADGQNMLNNLHSKPYIRWAFGPRRVRVRLAILDVLFVEFFDIGPRPGAIEPPRTTSDGGPERFCWPLGAPGLTFLRFLKIWRPKAPNIVFWHRTKTSKKAKTVDTLAPSTFEPQT